MTKDATESSMERTAATTLFIIIGGEILRVISTDEKIVYDFEFYMRLNPIVGCMSFLFFLFGVMFVMRYEPAGFLAGFNNYLEVSWNQMTMFDDVMDDYRNMMANVGA